MRGIKTIIVTMAIGWMVCMTAYAAQRITSVSISITESKTDPGVVSEAHVTSSGRQYEIVSSEPSKDYGSWSPGTKVTFDVEIEPLDGYTFDTGKVKNVRVSNGEVASKSIKSSSIKLKVNYIAKVTLENPQNIYWEDEYTAKWDKVEYCNSYEVRLFKTNENGEYKSYKTVTVNRPEIDLSTYATDGHELRFKVRSVAKSSKQSEYLKASEWVDCDDSIIPGDNTTYGNLRDTGDGITFKNLDGTYAVGWQLINNNWYYFNPDNRNKAVTSAWAKLDDKWFWFNAYGIMQTGWVHVDAYWYYLNQSGDGVLGAMVTGWIVTGPNGPHYYLQPGTEGPLPEGALWTNARTPDGYDVNSAGEWVQ